ncbi:CRAL/TRIO domain-containing protein [Phthorimaea operculella]|nr:CRAL/TRIO domain-containing protein [Phthorimaea operculella]
MEALPQNEALKFNPDTLQVVRREYELDKPGAMAEAVDILNKWIQTQPHFMKKDFKPEYLERIIIACKGSIERSKERLDKLFTLRTSLPKFFQDFDPESDFQNIKEIIYYLTLPKLTKDHDRIFYTKICEKKFSANLFLEAYRYIILSCEYLWAHDYAQSYHIVLDYMDASISDVVAAVDLVDLRQGLYTLIEGYGLRIKGVHLLVNSKLVDVLVTIAKQVASEKIGKRVYTYKSYEELYQILPREVFPKELGGEEKPLSDLTDSWRKQILSEKFREYWKMMTSAKTDESLRPADKFNEQYLGMPGTFRTLSVD